MHDNDVGNIATICHMLVKTQSEGLHAFDNTFYDHPKYTQNQFEIIFAWIVKDLTCNRQDK